MYIGTNIFSIKQERNTYNYNLCFFNFSRGHYDYPSNILSVFPPPSPSTSAGLESEKVTHTFIAERSRPFVILPRLSCSYPVLSLRRRCVKKKKKQLKPALSCLLLCIHVLFDLHRGIVVQIPTGTLDQSLLLTS